MYKQILIGSRALKKWYPDLNREPKDTDFAVNQVKSNKDGVEYLYNPVFNFDHDVATPTELMTLKLSHLFWDTNWDKHMWDYQFLKEKGVSVDKELYKKFRNFFEDYLPKVKRSKLELSKDEFFTNAVNDSVSQHDDLHAVIAEVPAFTKILKENCEVNVCEDKFNALSLSEKFDVVIEETIVMAYERYSGRQPFYVGYSKQLKANIRKHFPEFIAIFAIDNFKELITIKNNNIQELFKKLNYDNDY